MTRRARESKLELLVESTAITGGKPFPNTHWLNPVFLMPLVGVSPGARTDAWSLNA